MTFGALQGVHRQRATWWRDMIAFERNSDNESSGGEDGVRLSLVWRCRSR